MSALRLAHRGDWRRVPENTLGAMGAALAIPACDGLEFDVRSSRDGVAVLLHDATLERVQGVPWACAERTAAELERDGVPTLAAVLALAGRPRNGRLPFLDVELKEVPGDSFVDALGASRGRTDGGLDRAVVSSFHPEALEELARRRPGWARWGNAMDLDAGTIAIARSIGCVGLSVSWPAITPGGMARARAAGLEVAAWTVRRRPTFDRLERLGVMAICVEAAALDG
ncbi:MAG TPA: glycerophosphodiester phosphodiesterase [Candidatus Limnocylindrales bacterium]